MEAELPTLTIEHLYYLIAAIGMVCCFGHGYNSGATA